MTSQDQTTLPPAVTDSQMLDWLEAKEGLWNAEASGGTLMHREASPFGSYYASVKAPNLRAAILAAMGEKQ